MSIDPFIYQLATSLGITSKALKNDMIELPEEMIQFPSLRPYIGEHVFRCMLVKTIDMEWFTKIASDTIKASKDPIFQTFRKCLAVVPEEKHKYFVLYIHTAGRAWCVRRTTAYTGQGAGLVRVGDDPLLYVIELYETWLSENTGRWREDGDEPIFE